MASWASMEDRPGAELTMSMKTYRDKDPELDGRTRVETHSGGRASSFQTWMQHSPRQERASSDYPGSSATARWCTRPQAPAPGL